MGYRNKLARLLCATPVAYLVHWHTALITVYLDSSFPSRFFRLWLCIWQAYLIRAEIGTCRSTLSLAARLSKLLKSPGVLGGSPQIRHRRTSMIEIEKLSICIWHPLILLMIPPPHRDRLPWRSGACTPNVYQALLFSQRAWVQGYTCILSDYK